MHAFTTEAIGLLERLGLAAVGKAIGRLPLLVAVVVWRLPTW